MTLPDQLFKVTCGHFESTAVVSHVAADDLKAVVDHFHDARNQPNGPVRTIECIGYLTQIIRPGTP